MDRSKGGLNPKPRGEQDLAAQIEALLSSRAVYYVMKRYGVDRIDTSWYRESFTVDRQAILDYIAARQLRIEDYAPFHGMRLVERNGKWLIIERDEYCESETSFPDEASARKWLLEYILKHTYTGIDFSL